VSAAVTAPHRPLPELFVLSPAERHHLLQEWNDNGFARGALRTLLPDARVYVLDSDCRQHDHNPSVQTHSPSPPSFQ